VTTSLDTMYRKGGVPYGPSKAGHEALVAIMAQGARRHRRDGKCPGARRRTNTNLIAPDTGMTGQRSFSPK